MIVIADGGSTKVDWRALSDNGAVKGMTTAVFSGGFLFVFFRGDVFTALNAVRRKPE